MQIIRISSNLKGVKHIQHRQVPYLVMQYAVSSLYLLRVIFYLLVEDYTLFKNSDYARVTIHHSSVCVSPDQCKGVIICVI